MLTDGGMENCTTCLETPVTTCEPEPPCSNSFVSYCAIKSATSYQTNGAPCLASNVNFNNILNLNYSDLSSTCYNYFLHGFRDERDFEEFKQDLRDFLRLKRECWAANHGRASSPGSGRADNALEASVDDEAFCDLNEELEVICRPSSVYKNRRRHSSSRHHCGKDAAPTADPEGAEPFHCERGDQASSTEGLADTTHFRSDNCKNCGSHLLESRGRFQARQDSFALREDFDRRSGLFEPHHRVIRRSGLPLARTSINHILMEFINGDEHFREFDRVYETVNGNNGSSPPAPRPASAEENRQVTNQDEPHTGSDGNNNGNDNGNEEHTSHPVDDNGNSDDDSPSFCANSGGPRDSLLLYRGRETLHRPSYVDDMLADFFDNDETFLEFEQEFQKFKSKRRSQLLLRSLSNMGSSKDIFGDLKAFCDRTLQQKERQRIWRMSSSKTMDSEESMGAANTEEAAPVCPSDGQESQEAGHEPLIWRSVEDWERMLRKMKRNSRLLLDRPGHHAGQQPHHKRQSVHGFTRPRSSHGQQYDRTQSLADLTRCHGNSTPPSGNANSVSRAQLGPGPSSGARHSCCSLDSKSLDRARDIHHKRSSVPNLAECSRTSSVDTETADKPESTGGRTPRNVSLEECKEVSLDDLLPTPTECKAAKWANNFSVDSEEARYSSTSTLCSSNGGDPIEADDADNEDESTSSFSFSCSLGSDLHIHEDGDYTDDDLDRVPPGHGLRQGSCPPSTRSRSLMELSVGPKDREADTLSLQSTHSAGNILYSSPCDPLDRESSVDMTGPTLDLRPAPYCRAASVPCCSYNSRSDGEQHQLHRPTTSASCDEAVCDIDTTSTAPATSRDAGGPSLWSAPRPPSAVSDRLSDLESNDTYDTATSDLSDAELSDQFSSAKSDLSAGPLAAAAALSSLSTRSRSFDLDLSDISGTEEDDEDDFTPGSSPPDADRQWARHGVKDITARYEQAFAKSRHNSLETYGPGSNPYSRGHCHSYHGRETRREPSGDRNDKGSARPLSSSGEE